MQRGGRPQGSQRVGGAAAGRAGGPPRLGGGKAGREGGLQDCMARGIAAAGCCPPYPPAASGSVRVCGLGTYSDRGWAPVFMCGFEEADSSW